MGDGRLEIYEPYTGLIVNVVASALSQELKQVSRHERSILKRVKPISSTLVQP